MEREQGVFLYHTGCPSCDSSDGRAVYKKDDGSVDSYCWVCETYFPSDKTEEKQEETITHMENLVVEDFSWVKELPMRGWKERRIPKQAAEKFGVHTEGTPEAPEKRYYPVTVNGEVMGYKIRIVEGKKFSKVGYAKSDCDLFGQSAFPAGGKFLCIAEGEESAMALWSALRSDKYETPVVSPTSGVSSLEKQIKRNYDYINSFENVIFFLDNDEPGQEATEKACKLLPPGKAKIADMKLKDPDEYTKRGRDNELKKLMWEARRYSPAGIVGSSTTWQAMVDRAKTTKVTLPDFAHKLQDMMRGGFGLGEIVNFVAPSGIGKSTFVNRFVHHWVMNTEYKVGVISLEADVGEYTEALLSVHLGRNLAVMDDDEKIRSYAKDPSIMDGYRELTLTENNDDRYYLLDHQGDVADDDLKKKIEYLVRVLGCKIILLDPLTLALSGGKNEDVDEFMSWLLRLVKRENILFVNVCHVRKNQSGQKANSAGGNIHEEDVKGSGSIFQIGMINILAMRDKENEDENVRNTTRIVTSKARRTGQTGPSGFWRYDSESGKVVAVDDPGMDTSADEEFFDELGVLDDHQNDEGDDTPPWM